MAYEVQAAEFSFSVAKPDQLPPEGEMEVAFAGRSNVGKSSLMNMLLTRRNLVRTSKTPGCTRAINFFAVQFSGKSKMYFVDLPGYGYAARSKEERGSWGPLINGYVETRGPLEALCVLVDARRGIEEDDEGLIDLGVTRGLRTIVVATKIDKVPRSKRRPMLAAIQRSIREPVIAASSVTSEGREPLLQRLLEAAEP